MTGSGLTPDRFAGPGGIELPRFARQIGLLSRWRDDREPGAPIVALTPFSGVLQPRLGPDRLPMPDLTYLILQPVVDQVIERETRTRQRDNSNVGSDRVRHPSGEDAPEQRQGQGPAQELTVADVLRGGQGSLSRDRSERREIRTLETERVVRPDIGRTSERGNPDQSQSVMQEVGDPSRLADRTKNLDRSRTQTTETAEPGGPTAASRMQRADPDESPSLAGTRSARHGRRPDDSGEPSDPQFRLPAGEPHDADTGSVSNESPPMTVRHDTEPDETGPDSNTDTAGRRGRLSASAGSAWSGPGTGQSSARGSHEHAARDESGPRTRPEMTLRSQRGRRAQSDGSTTDEERGTRPSSMNREEAAGVEPSAKLLGGEAETSRFVDRLYREFTRKMQIERERRGI